MIYYQDEQYYFDFVSAPKYFHFMQNSFPWFVLCLIGISGNFKNISRKLLQLLY